MKTSEHGDIWISYIHFNSPCIHNLEECITEVLLIASGIVYLYLYLFKAGRFMMTESTRMQVDSREHRCIPIE